METVLFPLRAQPPNVKRKTLAGGAISAHSKLHEPEKRLIARHLSIRLVASRNAVMKKQARILWH